MTCSGASRPPRGAFDPAGKAARLAEIEAAKQAEAAKKKAADEAAKKLAAANRSAATLLRQARRKAANPEMTEDSLDGFLNALDLGNPDPSTHRSSFNGGDDILDFFIEDKPDDWRQRD